MGSIPTRSRHPDPGAGRGDASAGPGYRSPGRGGLAPPFLLAALLFLLSSPAELAAQEGAGADTARSPVLRTEPAPADTAGPPVSALGAFSRSLVLPGWGQVAVDRPGRGAFYFGVEAASLFMVFRTQARLEAAQAGGDTALVNARKQQREDWIALSVFWGLFSGLDAWVSTQFWGYEGAVTVPEEGSAGAAVRVKVPLGGR